MAGLTNGQRKFVATIKQHTEGLTGVSTGLCPGCETCRKDYGMKVHCECAEQPCNSCKRSSCANCKYYCDRCDGTGKRALTEEEFADQISNGEIMAEPFFSWRSCDLCGSMLGGDFEPWHAIDSNGEIEHGARACMDCVAYLANGDLPVTNDA